MEEMGMCGIDTGASLSFLEEPGTNDSISRLILSNNLSYNLCSFVWELVHLGKSSSSKIVYVVENDISLYIAHKAITIVLIPNKYHQFRT